VGQAVALALARAGWRVALVGRRRKALADTAAQAGKFSKNLFCFPCDISDAAAVEKMSRAVLKKFESVDALVNAAATNTPRRSLRELSRADYRRLLDTNLDGAYNCVQAFLPSMRARQSGTIVNIVSDADVMSKFGLAGLTQAINAEEKAAGIRACAIFPGDIDTPLLELRPNPPPTEARQKMLTPGDIAACVMLAIQLPERAIVEEILIRPR